VLISTRNWCAKPQKNMFKKRHGEMRLGVEKTVLCVNGRTEYSNLNSRRYASYFREMNLIVCVCVI
jgi:hypothetical protein